VVNPYKLDSSVEGYNSGYGSFVENRLIKFELHNERTN